MKKGTMLVLAVFVLAVLLLVVSKRMRSTVPVKIGYPPAANYMPEFVPVDLDLTQTPTFKEEVFDFDIDAAQFGIEE